MTVPTDQYRAFLAAKVRFQHEHGFPLAAEAVHPLALPHQRDMIRWAVQKGRAALFASYGLGKTLAQLEVCRAIAAHVPESRALIVCPLGVRQEFLHDAAMLGYDGETAPCFVRRTEEVTGPGLYLTNYECVRDGKLDPTIFTVLTLDEAAILRSYGSKTFQTFLSLCESVPYRFVATATPSPNRYKELIHYAAFLGVMDSGQALTRFFQRDSEQANNLTLYPHMEGEFFAWLHSWALFLQSPADLGYDASRYTLPPKTITYHEVSPERATVATERDGQGLLIRDASIGVQDAAREKRESLHARLATLRTLVAGIGAAPFIVWCDLNDEQSAVEALLTELGITYASVHGGQDLDTQEAEVLAFKQGERQALIGKAVMLGAGVNLQRCATAMFLGVNHKYHDFAQATHRIHRFLQTQPVQIHVLHTEAERGIVRNLQRKDAEDQTLRQRMQALIQTYGLNDVGLHAALTREMGVPRREVRSTHFTAVHNDCVDETRRMADGTVDLIVTSIPFGNHYEYSANYNDFGHNPDHDAFFRQMDFLTPELLRILAPGRLACIHVKDRIRFGNVTGFGMPSVEPFHAECITHYRRHGFVYMGMITVVTDVVRENNQTYRLGWTEQCKDGTKMGVGSPEYVLLFRKLPTDRSKAYADVRVAKDKREYTRARWQLDAHAFWRSSGNRLLTAEELGALSPDMLAKVYERHSRETVYDFAEHVAIGQQLEARGALPATFMSLAPASLDPDVWHDVVRMRTLNGTQAQRGLANHVCLAAGSLVLTRRAGYVPIETVTVGDEVLTHTGRWRRVEVARATGVRPVLQVHAQGVPHLVVTPDHELWTRSTDWVRSVEGAKRATPGWVRADATRGQYLNQKLPPVESLDITPQEAWVVWRWLADGHVGSRGDFYVSIGEAKAAEFEAFAGELAGAFSVRTARQYRLKNLRPCVVDLLRSAGSGAGNKQVPPALLAAERDTALQVLTGYLAGDGHFVAARSTWMATSVSRALLLGLSMLVQRVYGAVSSVRAGRPAGSKVIEGRAVQTREEWVLSFDIPSADSHKKPFLLEDGAWKKVRDLPDAGEAETWCLRVEDDASFTAEGAIVKNCPLQLDIVERLIQRYTNPGELVFDPFGGLGTVPYVAILEGRRGAMSELNAEYFRDACRYLREAEEKVGTPTLFDLIDAEVAA